MDKFCTCKRYQKGVQADALFRLNKASNLYRDTLRVKDEHEGDSVVDTDDDDDVLSNLSENEIVTKMMFVEVETDRPGQKEGLEGSQSDAEEQHLPTENDAKIKEVARDSECESKRH